MFDLQIVIVMFAINYNEIKYTIKLYGHMSKLNHQRISDGFFFCGEEVKYLPNANNYTTWIQHTSPKINNVMSRDLNSRIFSK